MRAAPYWPRLWLATLIVLSACERTPVAPTMDRLLASSSHASLNAPSGVTAVAASQTRIDVTWQDNSTNETGFEIRRSTTGPDGAFLLEGTLGANTTSYADTGLTPGTQYCYKLRAVSVTRKATDYSTLTVPACATTLAPPPPSAPPQAPSDAIAVAVGSYAVGVRWSDNAIDEDGFRLEHSTDGGASWTIAGTTTVNIATTTDEGVASEVQVCYRVFAFNSQGDSPPSNTACATPIAGPTDLAADRQGFLTWTDNSAIEDGYEVWMMDAFSVAYDGLVATLPPNTTSFQTGGCSGWCHGFAVVAFKTDAYSDWAALFLPPAVPSNLTATVVSAIEVDLSWEDAPDAGELFAEVNLIERCTGDPSVCSDAEFVQIATLGNWPTTFRDTGVLGSTTYTYRVRAYSHGEVSAPSNTATATTQ